MPVANPRPPILLFGGTFDPPHRAHVVLPEQIARDLGCERIIYIPASRNPLKSDEPITPDEHRLAMLKLALRDVHSAEISTIELDRGGPSYFVDTLAALRAELGAEHELRFLIGADQALDFHRWKSWPRILELATPVVMLRPPWDRLPLRDAYFERYGAEEGARWWQWTQSNRLMDISAKEIRAALARGEECSEVIDPRVREYIEAHGLYRDEGVRG
jgi:nicotinate-nucleotide adenylyltransferase